MVCPLRPGHNKIEELEGAVALNWFGRRCGKILETFLSWLLEENEKIRYLFMEHIGDESLRARQWSSCGTEVWCDYTVSKIAITFNYLAGCTN